MLRLNSIISNICKLRITHFEVGTFARLLIGQQITINKQLSLCFNPTCLFYCIDNHVFFIYAGLYLSNLYIQAIPELQKSLFPENHKPNFPKVRNICFL